LGAGHSHAGAWVLGAFYWPSPPGLVAIRESRSATEKYLASSIGRKLTAGTALGLSTQNPMRPEFATASAAVPSAVADAVVHTGRPRSRFDLDASDAALFELLRDRARYSDLSPEETVDRLVRMLADRKRFERLAKAALDEPPRVRAMLGALGERASAPDKALQSLRGSLNPLTKFDFGVLQVLPNAKDWQAR
jgi:hypothetical protein